MKPAPTVQLPPHSEETSPNSTFENRHSHFPEYTAFFQRHLDSIRKSREQARAVIDTCGGEDVFSRAALISVWSTLFDECYTGMDDQKDLPAIVQKLCASTNNYHSLQIKLRELEHKEQDRAERKAQLQQTLHDPNTGLSPETLAHLEHQLNLL